MTWVASPSLDRLRLISAVKQLKYSIVINRICINPMNTKKIITIHKHTLIFIRQYETRNSLPFLIQENKKQK